MSNDAEQSSGGREPASSSQPGASGPGASSEPRGGSISQGAYEPIALLGRGGMGEVFLAHSRGPGGFHKLAVLKRLRPELADEGSFLEMFMSEARLASRLNHPHVVSTFGVGKDEASWFLAMEYLDGQPLNRVLVDLRKAGEKPPLGASLRIACDALSGLRYAHELCDYDGTPLTLVHRDVSPHNVFLTHDGIVKLVDFGIAKATSSAATESGVLKGKIGYIAPEQALGKSSPQTDLYSLGLVLWECLAGHRTYQGTTVEVLTRLVNVPAPSLLEAAPDVDPELAALVMRALEREPSARFASAREMRDALEAYAARSGHSWSAARLGDWLATTFGEPRAARQREIREAVARREAQAPPPEPPSHTLPSPAGLPPSADAATVITGGTGREVLSRSIAPSGAAPREPGRAEASPRRSGWLGFAAGVGSAVLIAAGAIVAARQAESPAPRAAGHADEADAATAPLPGPSLAVLPASTPGASTALPGTEGPAGEAEAAKTAEAGARPAVARPALGPRRRRGALPRSARRPPAS